MSSTAPPAASGISESGANSSPVARPRPGASHPAWRIVILLLIALPPASLLWAAAERDVTFDTVAGITLVAVLALTTILPLVAYSYFFFRRDLRTAELDRILTRLKLLDDYAYAKAIREVQSGPYFCLAVGSAWLISVIGLLVPFMWNEPLAAAGDAFPKDGSLVVFGMGFLGAYLWSVQYVMRRYVMNDLIPAALYNSEIRMVLAATTSVLAFNAFEVLGGEVAGTNGPGSAAVYVWPALAFLIGIFPQRGLQWLASRIPVFSATNDPSVRDLPLRMIEGIESYDVMRLQELGIDTCYDLSNADFIPLMLNTSYSARELTDWILQAKLCVHCGTGIRELRLHGIRTIVDLTGPHEKSPGLSEEAVRDMAKMTSLTESSLLRAKDAAEHDPEIQRLREVTRRLGEFAQLG